MIAVVGLSHHTAAIDVRERLAFPREQVAGLIQQLKDGTKLTEVLVLSTCNRVEVLMAGPDESRSEAAESVRQALEARAPGVGQYLYVHHGRDAVRHVFRVASSLDSIVLGEPQILGQFKEAFEIARASGALSGTLHRVVSRAIRAAKHVRSQTSIGSGQVSVPSVAVDLTRQIFGELKGRHVLLVGSGEMAETVARLLATAGCRLSILGRNEARVSELSRAMGGTAKPWNELPTSLEEADVVITSTSASSYIIDRATVERAKRSRRGRNLFFVDLAVPRDVDPAVEHLDGVFLYNVDDFSRVVTETASARQREAERAEQIITDEVAAFHRWVEAERATPAIVALRARFEQVLQGELERSLKGRLKHLATDDREALNKMLSASINKLLHGPTVKLRQNAVAEEVDLGGVEQALELLLDVFELEEAVSDAEASEAALEDPTDDPLAEIEPARTGGN